MSQSPSIRSHPPVDAWIDYHAGKTSNKDAEALREHLSRCRLCVDLVLDLDAFAELSPTGDATADFERAAVWRTVKHGILDDQHDGAVEQTERDLGQGNNRGEVAHHAPIGRRWLTAAVGTAAMLFAAIGLSQHSARTELESQVAELTRLQPNVEIVDLRPGARERSSRGVDATVEVPAGNVTLILHLEEDVDYPEYQLRIFDSKETEVDRITDLRISDVGNFSLGLAPGSLAAGDYELQLFGLVEGAEQRLEIYPIRLR